MSDAGQPAPAVNAGGNHRRGVLARVVFVYTTHGVGIAASRLPLIPFLVAPLVVSLIGPRTEPATV
ncbi:MAG: hypothetical protein MUC56_15970 [Thermoanaerobaculales bacterium]|jgi:hypothetical protein|nr:hypothetical protein [Thermoanaerobaculales bacterium]